MNKKLLTLSLAALIGAASMTACVKNNESASVTNLRNAKTMQIKSMAELNTAQAQGELIRANAEKALKEAEAAYQNALAAVQTATAAEKQIAVDKAKAVLAADIQAALQKAEADLISAKNAYNLAWKIYEEFRATNPNPYLAQLMVQYEDYNTAYEQASNDWTQAKSQLLGLKTDLITAQEVQATAIAGFNNTIAENEALLAVYNTLPAGDKLAAKQALEASKAKVSSLQVGQKAVADPVNAAVTAIKAGQVAINGNAAAPEVKGNAYYEAAKQANVPASYVKYDKTTDASNVVAVATYVASGSNPYNGLTPITIGLDAQGLPTYTKAGATNVSVTTAAINELELAKAVATAVANEKATDKAYTDKVAAQTKASGDKTYAELVDAAELARQAYLKAIEEGKTDDVAQKAHEAAAKLVTDWDTAVATEFDADAKAKAGVKALKDWQAIVTLKANVDEYNAQLQEIADAKVAYDGAIAAFAKINDPILIEEAIQANLLAIYNGTVDTPALIASTKKKLDEAKAELAEVAYSNGGTFSKEQAIALKERQIAAAEGMLKGTQVLIDQVKAKIDAEIKK